MDAQELIGKSMLRMEFVRGVEGAAPYRGKVCEIYDSGGYFQYLG